MIGVFADTVYWIALVNRSDQLHAKVAAMGAELQSLRVITSEMVLAEFLNGTSNDAYLRLAAARLVDRVRAMGTVTVVPQTAEQFAGALGLYKKADDKEWSLTDCASFLIMEQRGIRAALTHDHHFAQAGFEALLR
jgi:predicted nucleic acid-binding protein